MLDRLFDWLFDALRAPFKPYLVPPWKSLALSPNFTLILLALGASAMVLLVKKRHRIAMLFRRDELRQHDRAIFAEADALLTEVGLMDTLRTLATLHAFTGDELRAMTHFGYYFEETGHHYLDKNIGDATVRLLRTLNNLLDFTAQYSVVPGLSKDREDAAHGLMLDDFSDLEMTWVRPPWAARGSGEMSAGVPDLEGRRPSLSFWRMRVRRASVSIGSLTGPAVPHAKFTTVSTRRSVYP